MVFFSRYLASVLGSKELIKLRVFSDVHLERAALVKLLKEAGTLLGFLLDARRVFNDRFEVYHGMLELDVTCAIIHGEPIEEEHLFFIAQEDIVPVRSLLIQQHVPELDRIAHDEAVSKLIVAGFLLPVVHIFVEADVHILARLQRVVVLDACEPPPISTLFSICFTEFTCLDTFVNV
jgi:hypothetical protein